MISSFHAKNVADPVLSVGEVLRSVFVGSLRKFFFVVAKDSATDINELQQLNGFIVTL